MPPRSNTKEFIEKATKVHNGRFDYLKVEYVNNSTHVIVTCEEHGEFSVNPNSHLKGTNCPKCSGNRSHTTEEFIEKSKKKFGDFLDYSKVEYRTDGSIVTLSCPNHGEYTQRAATHLRSVHPCPKCAKESSAKIQSGNTEDFVKRAEKIHGDKFDYSLVNYVSSKTKVDIICKQEGHGVFSQSPGNHLRKSGCSMCAKHNRGWTKTDWFNSAKKSANFESFKVYLFEVEGDGEKFYKIGKTFREFHHRLTDIRWESHCGYTVKEIDSLTAPDESKNSSDMIFDIENYCHGYLKKYSYKPKIPFGGDTECFSKIPDDFDFLKMAISLPTNLPTYL